jgi:peptide-methionine (S)-S-oxide reductase
MLSLPFPSRRRAPLGAVASLCVAVIALPLLARCAPAAESAVVIPPPKTDAGAAEGTRTIVLAGGCFWGMQAVYQHTRGVTRALAGYAGGSRATARYDLVTSGRTGHAEAIEITFDPKIVSYGKLLQIFFSVAHNPTHLNHQGADDGPQYRSAIFVADAEQERVAKAYIAELDAAKVYRRRIATVVAPLKEFYPAEDEHQDFAALNPDEPYIVNIDQPKVDNLKKLFVDDYREEPVLVKQPETN